MNASRSAQMPIDWTRAKNPEAGCKAQIVKFVRGINGQRQTAVTAKQIERWVRFTPQEFVSKCLTDLVSEGRVRMCQKSLSSGRRSNGSYVYVVDCDP